MVRATLSSQSCLAQRGDVLQLAFDRVYSLSINLIMIRPVLFFLVAIFAAFFASADDYNCPTSGSSMHAGCQVYTQFQTSCSAVQIEMNNRLNAQASGEWRDPHNNGTYTIVKESVDLFQVSRITGDGKYTDLINFNFGTQDLYGSTCDLYSCSESQVFSIGDMGTNFCNIHDLYCSEAGCNPFTTLQYTEKAAKCTEMSPKKCIA